MQSCSVMLTTNTLMKMMCQTIGRSNIKIRRLRIISMFALLGALLTSTVARAEYFQSDDFKCANRYTEKNGFNLGDHVVFVLVGDLGGFPEYLANLTSEMLSKQMDSGALVCVGKATKKTFSQIWNQKGVEHIVYLGHGIDGTVTTQEAEDLFAPEQLTMQTGLRSLLFVSCETMRKSNIWLTKAPNALIVGTKDPLPMVTAPILFSTIRRLMQWGSEAQPGTIMPIERVLEKLEY